jgi:putative flippase GtrA
MRSEVARFVRFGIVGVANTLLTLLTFALLTRAGVAASAASAAGFLVGAGNGYVLNRAWTFRSRGGAGTLARYVPVQAVGALASATGVSLASTDARLHRLAAECLVVPAVTLLTYSLSRRFVFRPLPHARRPMTKGAPS